MNEVRTYMSFTYPIDPVKIVTIPDMDLSFALGSTLVEWDPEKQVSAGLAESWKVIKPNVYRFTIRKDARWSDGRKLLSSQVRASFKRAMEAHPEDLRSLIQMVASIDCPSELEVDFKLKRDALGSGLLGKLAEGNFGILKINAGGALDLSVTTGPFFLAPRSNPQEVALIQNLHWHRFSQETPPADRVIIRRSPDGIDLQSILLTDSWPNLTETSSLIKPDRLHQYETKGYSLWRRPIDKVFVSGQPIFNKF